MGGQVQFCRAHHQESLDEYHLQQPPNEPLQGIFFLITSGDSTAAFLIPDDETILAHAILEIVWEHPPIEDDSEPDLFKEKSIPSYRVVQVGVFPPEGVLRATRLVLLAGLYEGTREIAKSAGMVVKIENPHPDHALVLASSGFVKLRDGFASEQPPVKPNADTSHN